MPPITIMIKPVSGACNLRCRYCFYADEASHRALPSYGKMSESTQNNLIRKAFIYADEGISFAFQGGEPLLAGIDFYRSFIKTVKEYNVRGLDIRYSIQTNATLLTDELCAFFAENEFLVGVSLDGTKEIHDFFRTDGNGNGTHERVISGIKLLEKHRVEFNILCVLTAKAAENVRAVWRKLEKYGFIQFIPCIDPFEKAADGFAPTPEQYSKALVEIFDLYKEAIRSSAPVTERRMDNYISMLMGYPPEHCGMSGKCGTYFLCEADGSVFPCDFYVLDKWKMGNINETSFARMEKGEVMLEFQKEGSTLPAECLKCEFGFICRGGCRRDREPKLTANRFCESYKYFFTNRLEEMKELAKSFK